MSKYNRSKITIAMAIAMLITNPLTGQYVVAFTDWLFEQMFTYGAWITVVACAWIIGVLLLNVWETRPRTNIPNKIIDKV